MVTWINLNAIKLHDPFNKCVKKMNHLSRLEEHFRRILGRFQKKSLLSEHLKQGYPLVAIIGNITVYHE